MTERLPGGADLPEPERGPTPGEEADLVCDDPASEDGPETGADEAPGPTPRARRGCGWWSLAVGGSLLALLGLVAAVLYNFGTMEAPAPQIQAEYDQLVARRRVPPEAPSPGFRIPIPGCRCHAADADIGLKQPGRQPDVTIVIAHRYLTISQCMDCHGTEQEPAGIEGQPLEDSPPQ